MPSNLERFGPHDPESCRKRLEEVSAKLTVWEKFRILKAIRKLATDKAMKEKLLSRKLWITVAAAAIAALLSGLGIAPDMIDHIIKLAMTYIGSQAVVDAVAAVKK